MLQIITLLQRMLLLQLGWCCAGDTGGGRPRFQRASSPENYRADPQLRGKPKRARQVLTERGLWCGRRADGLIFYWTAHQQLAAVQSVTGMKMVICEQWISRHLTL